MSKFKNLEELDSYLGSYRLPTLRLKYTESLNSPITKSATDSVIKIIPTKITGADGFTAQVYQIFKQELLEIILNSLETSK